MQHRIVLTRLKPIMMLIALILLSVLSITQAQNNGCIQNTTFPGRLPTSFSPKHYHILLNLPNPDAQTAPTSFTGTVKIDIVANVQSSCIVLNANNLQFSTVNVMLIEGGDMVYSPTNVSFSGELVTIQFATTLNAGSAFQLVVSGYTAQIQQGVAQGLFLSDNSFQPDQKLDIDRARRALQNLGSRSRSTKKSQDSKSSQNKPKIANVSASSLHMFATQFEFFEARTVFPSFDEPAFKSTFEYTLSVPDGANLTVLSNTPESSRKSDQGKLTVKFERTIIPMSSYLVAFAVGQFDFLEQVVRLKDGSKFHYRIYTPPGSSQYAAFALNASVSAVELYQSPNAFGLDYSKITRKMDQISVPAINYDAMENIGLLTYFPGFLLCDAPNTPEWHLELISLVTTHEIAHQWFGDTVTCPWWTQEYLQEGFARYLQYWSTNILFPEWNVWTHRTNGFVGDESYFGFSYNTAMQADMLGLSPPVVVLDQHGTAMSTMLYEKGASLNRMMELVVGEQIWLGMLRTQIKRHKFTNPDVFDLMDSFADFYQIFPAVQATLLANGHTLVITQSPVSELLPQNLTWFLPLIVRAIDPTGSQPNFETKVFVAPGSASVSVELPQPVPFKGWTVDVNHNDTDYLVVLYGSTVMWNKVFTLALSRNYTNTERIQLIRGVTVLSKTIHVLLNIPLTLASNTLQWVNKNREVNEAYDVIPLMFQNYFDSLVSISLPYTIVSNEFSRKFTSALFEPLLSWVGWVDGQNDSVQLTTLRSSLTFWAVFYNDTIAQAQAQMLWNNFINQGQPISASVERAVYWVMASNSSATYSQLYNYYVVNGSTLSAQQATDMLFGLTAQPFGPNECSKALGLIAVMDFSDIIQPLSDMMHYSVMCTGAAWGTVQRITPIILKQDPSALPQLISTFDGLFANGILQQQVQKYLTTYGADANTINQQLQKIFVNEQFINYNCCTEHPEEME